MKRNVEKVWDARYTLVASYLSKNTVYHGFDDVFLHRHSQQVIPLPTCKPKDHTTCQVIIMLGTSHDEGC
jgi:hypothetical protein